MTEAEIEKLLKRVWRNGALAFKLSLAEAYSKQGELGTLMSQSVLDHPVPEYSAIPNSEGSFLNE